MSEIPEQASGGVVWQSSPPGSIYDYIRVASFSIGPDGLVEQWSRRAVDLFGVTAEEARGKDPVEALETSIKALTPVLEVKSRRVGGATYQVPVEVPQRRARTLAVRWLVGFARARRERSMAQRLANELLDAQQQEGGAHKRKDVIFRMAQANKAFAHYRW